MGSLQAQDIQNFASLEVSLHWHLTSNHYPPIPTTMVPIAKEAIENAQEYQYDEDGQLLDYLIDLPQGITWRGHTRAPVGAIMDELHLWDFVQSLEELDLQDDEDF